MPTYCYRCLDCEEEFEARHGMSYDKQDCLKCESRNLIKISNFTTEKKSSTISKTRIGKVVDDYIREVKQEIKNEKKQLKSETM
jgi:putative FmdB family regulatory protein